MGKKVLIVDDEQLVRAAITQKFTAEGFSVISAGDGREGLEVANAERPDIILLDIRMPVMDGVEMLQKLREDLWGKTVPVILLTNSFDMDNVSRVVQYDVHEYLVKADWTLSDVVKKVKEKLGVE